MSGNNLKTHYSAKELLSFSLSNRAVKPRPLGRGYKV